MLRQHFSLATEPTLFGLFSAHPAHSVAGRDVVIPRSSPPLCIHPTCFTRDMGMRSKKVKQDLGRTLSLQSINSTECPCVCHSSIFTTAPFQSAVWEILERTVREQLTILSSAASSHQMTWHHSQGSRRQRNVGFLPPYKTCSSLSLNSDASTFLKAELRGIEKGWALD